jgi:hypothetical protein
MARRPGDDARMLPEAFAIKEKKQFFNFSSVRKQESTA